MNTASLLALCFLFASGIFWLLGDISHRTTQMVLAPDELKTWARILLIPALGLGIVACIQHLVL